MVINTVVEIKKNVKKPTTTEMVTAASLEACRVALDDGIVDITEAEMVALLEAFKIALNDSMVDISDDALVIVLMFVVLNNVANMADKVLVPLIVILVSSLTPTATRTFPPM